MCGEHGEAALESYLDRRLIAIVPHGRHTRRVALTTVRGSTAQSERPAALPAVGSVFARRYRIDTCLGKGGMGAVYGVTDQQTGQGLALKVLAEKKGEKDEQVTRFFREAKASMKLASEHLVRVFEVGTADELPYMLMEHLRGEDLSEVTKNGGSAEPAIVAGWTVEVCEALAHAHAVGIIHRDIKPSNLFLCEATGAEPARIKVLDFGISKMTSREEIEKTATLTGGSSLIGSPQYISPEQLRDPRSVDARADIWSLGVVMYRMLSGRLPFDGDTLGTTFVAILEREPSPIGAGVPVLLEGIVRRCLSKKREDRYASVAELARDLVPVAGPYYESYVERIAMVLAPSSGSATVGRMRSAPSVPARPQVGPKPGDPSTLTLDGDDAELSAIRARSTPSSSPLPAAASAPPAPGAPYASFAPAPFASGAPSPYASFAHQFTPTPGSVSLPVIPGPAPLPSTMGPVSFGDPMAARRSSRAPLVASMAALALLVVGAIAAKTMASGGRDQATSAVPQPSAVMALPAAPTAPAPVELITLTLAADGPIDSVRAAGLQRVDLAGARATLVVSAWSGPLAIEVALANGQRARVIAEADGTRDLRLTPSKPVATAVPSVARGARATPKPSAKPVATSSKPGELHDSPYANPN